MMRRPPRSTLFPYPPLFRSNPAGRHDLVVALERAQQFGLLLRLLVLRPEDQEGAGRSEEHTSELQSHSDLVCRLLLEKKKQPSASADPRKFSRCTSQSVVRV